ncbi:MAG: type II secretion system protein GspM [Desulfobacterales bacterium]|jgi:general secretion pathway protein M
MAKKLARREKYSLYALSGVICLFVVFQFIVFPSLDKRERLNRTLKAKTDILEKMTALQSEYNTLKQRTELSKSRFAKRDAGFTLFSFLDKLSGKAGIKNHVTYMKPSTSVQKNSPFKISQVEMKLQGLTLQQLTSYLHMVETSSNMVNIKRLSISKTGKIENLIDAVLQVETAEK